MQFVCTASTWPAITYPLRLELPAACEPSVETVALSSQRVKQATLFRQIDVQVAKPTLYCCEKIVAVRTNVLACPTAALRPRTSMRMLVWTARTLPA
jgi:hypothetical protein